MPKLDDGPPAGRPEAAGTPQGMIAEARARASRGDLAGAVEVWRRLLQSLPQDAGRWPVLDRMLESFAGLPGVSGGAEEAATLEERLQGPLDALRRSELLRRLGWGRVQRGDVVGARLPLEEAFRAAAGARAQKALVLGDLGWLEFAEGRPDLARARFEEALELSPAGHPARHRAAARLALLQVGGRDPASAERVCRVATGAAADGGDLHLEAACLAHLVPLLLDQGRVEECIRLTRGWAERLAAASPDKDKPLPQRVAEAEAALLRQTLESVEWNQSRAARALGISEQAVRYKMKKYGIRRPA